MWWHSIQKAGQTLFVMSWSQTWWPLMGASSLLPDILDRRYLCLFVKIFCKIFRSLKEMDFSDNNNYPQWMETLPPKHPVIMAHCLILTTYVEKDFVLCLLNARYKSSAVARAIFCTFPSPVFPNRAGLFCRTSNFLIGVWTENGAQMNRNRHQDFVTSENVTLF